MPDNNQQNHDDRQWLRQYKLHQEEILYSRINIFVVVLSIFVAIFGAAQSQDAVIAFAVLLLGAVLTIVWWLAVHRQNVIVNDYRFRLDVEDPLFRKWREDRWRKDKEEGRKRKRVSGQKLVIYVLPSIFGVFWVFALVWLIAKVLIGPLP